MGSNLRTQKAGRPSVVDEHVLHKLENALCSGVSIDFACDYAGISKSTFFEHKALNEEFRFRMQRAEEWSTMKARQIILQAIDKGDVKAAMWWLERKSRMEFAPPKGM